MQRGCFFNERNVFFCKDFCKISHFGGFICNKVYVVAGALDMGAGICVAVFYKIRKADDDVVLDSCNLFVLVFNFVSFASNLNLKVLFYVPDNKRKN